MQAWNLALEEMSSAQQAAARTIFLAEMISLGGVLAISIGLAASRRMFTRWLGGVPLFLSVIALATVFSMGERAIPAAVADWMLPRDQWMLKQFVLLMPAALFGALRLLCPYRAGQQTESLLRAGTVCLGLFAACLGFLVFIGPLMAGLFSLTGVGDAGRVFQVAVYLALSTLAAAGILRVCISQYVRARVHSPTQLAALTFLVAVAGPLLGLLLNASIPFPANFQLPAIYLLAVVNGLVLMLPNFSHPAAHRVVWLTQCALFPFTVYFFAVFLPFLTLGPLAMLFVGLGALMYVPSLLFLLHGCRLIDGFRAEIRDGRKWVPAVLGVAAILVWPAAYTIQARSDRAVLHRALDYLQYPDYATNARFEGSLQSLRSGLGHLQDFKQGIYMPYLSEYYNWLTFDNLVLPQSRIDSLSETFFGQPLPKSPPHRQIDLFGWGRSGARTVTEQLAGVQGTRPPADATLARVETTSRTDAGTVRSLTAMTVQNPTRQTTEFRTTIEVPPGVLISGLWLTIGTERVPGRIFEKRSAMWVYQKITEVRPVPQDPAILRYLGPNMVELKVYPVEANTPRFVEVEFLYPEGLNPDIRIAGHGKIETPESTPAPSLMVAEDGGLAVTIPPSDAYPVTTRNPYFHFLIDVSRGSRFVEPGSLREALRRITRQFPEIRQARLSFVNFETSDFRDGALLSVDDLPELTDQDLLPPGRVFQGGFLQYRAIKQVLWQHHLALRDSGSMALHAFPQVVVLRGSKTAPLPDETGNLSEFARWLPDLPGYWTLSAEGASSAKFVPLGSSPTRSTPGPVHIFQAGTLRISAAPGSPVSFFSTKAGDDKVPVLEVFDPATDRFVPVAGTVQKPTSPAYGRAILPWGLEWKRIFEPFRHQAGDLGALLQLCRETGILVPSVAYMVVENTAQWKMLERTEKKTLKGHEALELAEPAVPEPGTLVLIMIGGAFLLARSRRTRPNRSAGAL